MIEIRNLSFSYEFDRPVLKGIDLDLREGEWVSVLGTNGSGKSSLLKCIVGLLRPDKGTIERIPGKEGSTPRIGLVFQNPDDQIVSPVVESEIAFGLENLGTPRDEMVETVNTVLSRFDLEPYRRQDPNQLSGGERQRLAIASIVATRPDFLLFDEPFSMLDPALKDDLSELIRNLKSDGVTPIVVGQNPDEALDADRILVCSEGRIVEDSEPTTLLSEPTRLSRSGLTTSTVGRLAHATGMPPPVPVALTHLDKVAEHIPQIESQPIPTASSDRVAISCTKLEFSYSAGLPTEHEAIKSIDLEILQGETVSLIGPSGSGKSTLALHLNGLHTPTSGHCEVLGIDVSDKKSHDLLRQQVGLVFQFPESQLFGETVAEDVAYGPVNHGMDNVADRVDAALTSVGLDTATFRDRNPFTLSGGEKRRVALAGVLATSPSILVLDEPTAGLDPSGADELDILLQNLHASGMTILLITHDLDRAANLTERAIAIAEGRVAFDLTTSVALRDDSLLAGAGLTSPTGVQIIQSLREGGLRLPEHILTSDQLVAELSQDR